MNVQDLTTIPPPAPPSEAAPPPTTRVRREGLFPEILGVALVAVLMVGVLGLGLVNAWTLADQAAGLRDQQRDALAQMLAAAFSARTREDAEEITPMLARLNETLGVEQVLWRGADGKTNFVWPTARAAEAGTYSEVVRQPVVGADQSAAGTLEVTLARAATSANWGVILQGCAAALAATLIVYLFLYRQLRRRLRPMSAIQQNLAHYSAGVETELVSLQLSRSLGTVAEAWNELVGQLAGLRQTADADAPASGDALQRFESRALRSLFDRLPLGVMRIGDEQKVEYANAAVARTLRIAADDVVGADLETLVGERVGPALCGALARGSGTCVDRKPLSDEDGGVALRFTLLPADTASADGAAIVTVEDISHLHEAEQARDSFLYHVTHELRTPLTNIQAYAETLTGPEFDDEQTRRECYNVIISETRRLSRLVEDILSVSQLEVGSARMEMGEIDLARLVRQTVQDHLGSADEKQIDLSLKLPPKVPKLRGDKQRLSVLFNNLIGNAIKYTPNNGQVDVTLELSERRVLIAVRDNGIGIAPEEQAHVFEKFYRASNEAVQTITGTGLGLAIAREVVRLHGGDLRLESKLGEGSTFRVELPAPLDA